MKFFATLVPLLSLAITPISAAPSRTAIRADADASNSTISSALAIVQSFKSTLDTYNSSITSTHDAFVSSGDLATATSSYEAIVSEMTDAFNSAANQVVSLTGVDISTVRSEYTAFIPVLNYKNKRSTADVAISKRQAASLITEIEMVLEELTAAIQTIVGDLGLTTTLSFLNPLLSALGNLLLALVPVVNNLLMVVEQLLDSLLIGLGTGLGGIVL